MTLPPLRSLLRTALGYEKADLLITNARVVNVYSGEVLDNWSVGIKDQWIAYLGKEPNICLGSGTNVIDAQGKTVIPGFIDAHTHIAGQFYTPADFVERIIPGGTTTVIAETLETFVISGASGLMDLLKAFKDQPISIYSLVPPNVSISKAVQPLNLETLNFFLQLPEILGMGETYWQELLQEPDTYLPLFEQTLKSGKTLEGHAAGARGHRLNAYLSAGISSCHEPINGSEALERLRQGLYVMIREGSIRRDLDKMNELKELASESRRLILVTDSVSAHDLIHFGYLEKVVQKAIDSGFDPVRSIQMASLNPAEHFGLDRLIGGIAPGRLANLLIIPDLNTIQPEWVFSKGKAVARDGNILVSARRHQFQPYFKNTVQLPESLSADSFCIKVPRRVSRIKVRVIDQTTDLVTQEIIEEVPVEKGEIKPDIEKDLLKVAAIDRVINPGKIFTGLIHGFQMKSGAIASSAAWDTTDIIVVGADESDMAVAVNRILSMQGGIVLCSQGQILAEVSLPVFGIMPEESIERVVDKLETLKKQTRKLGMQFSEPTLTLDTLTTPAIPFFRICEEGLVNLKNKTTLRLFVD